MISESLTGQIDYGDYAQQPEERHEGKLKYVVVGIIIVAFISLVALSMMGTKTSPDYRPKIADDLDKAASYQGGTGACGDGKCSAGERCSSCATDCACPGSKVCDVIEGECGIIGFDVDKRVKERFGNADYDVAYMLTYKGMKKAGVIIGGEVKVISEGGEVEDILPS
ncbi:MAG: hypothetical protein HYX24_00505 [Candidatus Aenigmarchaeota archaeon]|nr:hypothetical protein [Candidatus Aenigmarchaeota archaeon]